MQCLRYLILALLMLCESGFASSCETILKYIQSHLPQFGTLKNEERFVYVDIDNEFIHKLVPLIQDEGFKEPPYFGSSNLVGAHITVIYPDEMKKYGIGEIKEVGKKIPFKPKECKVVHPPKWEEIDEVYFIVVEAPELDRIRKKYGLPKREYDFHITIGVKPKVVRAA